MEEMLYGDPAAQMESLRQTPGYQFRLEEGLRGLQRSAGSVTGNTLRELVGYGQGMASQEFGNRYNRLMGLSGQGMGAATATGRFGAASAARQGQYLQQATDTKASAYMGAGKLAGNVIGSMAGGQSFGGNLANLYGGGGGYGFGDRSLGSPYGG
jgi:hypothetical protein